MLENTLKSLYQTQIVENLNNVGPLGILMGILDIILVLFIIFKAFGLLKGIIG